MKRKEVAKKMKHDLSTMKGWKSMEKENANLSKKTKISPRTSKALSKMHEGLENHRAGIR